METSYDDNTSLLSRIQLDCLRSENPVEIDRGIRETIDILTAADSILSIAIAKVKMKKLYIVLGYRSMHAYIISVCDDTGADRSKVYYLISIGEALINHKTELEEISYKLKNGLTKLSHLEAALKNHDKEEVFSNLKTMSSRKFIDYANHAKAIAINRGSSFEIRGNALYIDGKTAITVNKNMEGKTKDMIMGMFGIICRALEKRGVLTAVHHRNWEEAEQFIAMAKRLREDIQKENDLKILPPKCKG